MRHIFLGDNIVEGFAILFVALIIIEGILVWRFVVWRKWEKTNESNATFEADDNRRLQYGYFLVYNSITGQNEYVDLNWAQLKDSCLVADNDEYYHIGAACLTQAYKDYKFTHEINYKIVSIDEAVKLGKKTCPVCAYNELIYDRKLEYELQDRKYFETTLIGSGTVATQNFLEFYNDIYEIIHISENKLFFDRLDNGRISVSVLCHFTKDEEKEFALYDFYGHKEKIGYLSSDFIKQIGIDKDNFESLTGLLKGIYFDDANKMYCEIIVFADNNGLTGIYSFREKEKGSGEN